VQQAGSQQQFERVPTGSDLRQSVVRSMTVNSGAMGLEMRPFLRVHLVGVL
jgi:hypothetical protein